MNQLQSLPSEEYGNLFVTMNPPFEPEESKVISRIQYDHALVDVKVRLWSIVFCYLSLMILQGVLAQRKMDAIQNQRGISFAGAWTNYTFHEDGFTSGLHAALHVSGTHYLLQISTNLPCTDVVRR